MITNEKQLERLTKPAFWIFSALIISFYLQLPFIDVTAGMDPRLNTAASEQKKDRTETLEPTVPVKSAESIESADSKSDGNVAETVHNETEIKLIVSDAKPEPQPDYLSPNANRGGIADRKEIDVLVHLINAEAYGLSYKAKVAVGQVVMNRWVGPYYGDDLLAIMTAPYQFTPIYDGSAYQKEIEPDSIEAAYAVLNGTGVKELTNDTYYFVDPDFTEDKTIERNMAFVCEIEGIHFFKPPIK